MKKVIMSLVLLILSWQSFADPFAYVSAYHVETECKQACLSDNFTSAGVVGLAAGYVGVELIFANSDIGGGLFLQKELNNDFRAYAGVASLPDTAIVSVPTYGDIQDSTNANAIMVGIDYKLLSVRYYQYEADHSATLQTYDATTKTYINKQTGSTSEKKSSVWAGVTYKF